MSVTFAQGFSAAGVEAGISATPGKKDVALVVNEGPLTAAAGVFTTNRFCAQGRHPQLRRRQRMHRRSGVCAIRGNRT